MNPSNTDRNQDRRPSGNSQNSNNNTLPTMNMSLNNNNNVNNNNNNMNMNNSDMMAMMASMGSSGFGGTGGGGMGAVTGGGGGGSGSAMMMPPSMMMMGGGNNNSSNTNHPMGGLGGSAAGAGGMMMNTNNSGNDSMMGYGSAAATAAAMNTSLNLHSRGGGNFYGMNTSNPGGMMMNMNSIFGGGGGRGGTTGAGTTMSSSLQSSDREEEERLMMQLQMIQARRRQAANTAAQQNESQFSQSLEDHHTLQQQQQQNHHQNQSSMMTMMQSGSNPSAMGDSQLRRLRQAGNSTGSGAGFFGNIDPNNPMGVSNSGAMAGMGVGPMGGLNMGLGVNMPLAGARSSSMFGGSSEGGVNPNLRPGVDDYLLRTQPNDALSNNMMTASSLGSQDRIELSPSRYLALQQQHGAGGGQGFMDLSMTASGRMHPSGLGGGHLGMGLGIAGFGASSGHGDEMKMTSHAFDKTGKMRSSGASGVMTAEDESKTKRRRHKKKPADMPRRPLSAYNLFFSEERERILKEIDGKDKNETETDKEKSEGGGETKKPQALLRPLLPSEKKRRPHRKTHGKISFRELAAMVGQRWKALPNDKRKYYQDLAKEDMIRQKAAMEAYYEKQAEKLVEPDKKGKRKNASTKKDDAEPSVKKQKKKKRVKAEAGSVSV